MATPNYEVNYDDERFDQVQADKDAALKELDDTYSGMIGQVDEHYDKLVENAEKWGEEQKNIQNEQTQHTIDQIDQQKDQAQKDYVKEQSGAYVDWQKQSNPYGAEAEKMASAGLTGTGFSESSQVSMYNTYQNRVAMARESFSRAVLNYNNAIKDAQLQNNALLAEIAYNTLQKQLELSLEGFQYKNQLILEQANKKTELNNTYYNRYLDVLNQINTENALAEDVRQFNENLIFQENQAELDRQHQSKENALNREHDSAENALNRQFQEKQAELDRQFTEAQNELNRQHDFAMLEAKTKAEKELLDKQHKQAMAKLAQQQKYQKELLQQEYDQQKALLDAQKDKGNELDGDFKDPDKMIEEGATKSEVRAEITKALKAGYITQEQANKLYEIYCPRGLTY